MLIEYIHIKQKGVPKGQLQLSDIGFYNFPNSLSIQICDIQVTLWIPRKQLDHWLQSTPGTDQECDQITWAILWLVALPLPGQLLSYTRPGYDTEMGWQVDMK